MAVATNSHVASAPHWTAQLQSTLISLKVLRTLWTVIDYYKKAGHLLGS